LRVNVTSTPSGKDVPKLPKCTNLTRTLETANQREKEPV
jgi:hypothetical protein